MEYIASLRKLIGHHPLLMVGATALIQNESGKVLLLKRTDNFCWGPPGGACDPGENVEDGLSREVLEETGLVLEGVRLFEVFSGPEFYYIYPNGDEVYNVTIAYHSQIPSEKGQKILLNEEHSEWRWFDLTALPDNISPPISPVMKQFIISNTINNGE
jgi:ADP-ribose pyrophosphatase YjhB (NUDIX family)